MARPAVRSSTALHELVALRAEVRALGSALGAVLARGAQGRTPLRDRHAGWPVLQTMIDKAQLTMRKADMGIAALCASLVEDEAIRRRIFALLEAEFVRTEEASLAATGQKPLPAGAPVLRQSVELRNPCIDPLNCIQVDRLRRRRPGKKVSAEEAEVARAVVELSINGISGGLKNTG